MALIFCEGFDKYGPANSNAAGVGAMLTQGEWTSVGVNPTIVAPLSATGQAIQSSFAIASVMTKTLSASYGRLIGGIRFNPSSIGSGNIGLAGFLDAGTAQCCITLNGSTGQISLRNGSVNGTALATSSASVSAGTTHYLEWDVAFGNSAAYQVWLDGVSVFSGTGDTTATANNTANQFGFLGTGTASACTVDDLYLFDSTGTTNNAVLLTSPRVETSFPASDSAVQFGFGAGILGSGTACTNTGVSTTANQLYLRPLTPAVACTISSIVVGTFSTNASINLRPVIYADSAGVPGTLMSAGATVTGITGNSSKTMPLTTSQSLSAGTQYWLGYMCDIAAATGMVVYDLSAAGRTATSTFASGAPGTAPAMTGGQSTVHMLGVVTPASAANWYETSRQPPPGILSYVLDSVVGHEDLYNMTPLSVPPAQIYAVAVKAYCAKSDAGTKTVSMRVKSGATDSGGSATGQAMGTSFAWLTSLFERDPNGNIAWTGANLNAAQCGFKVDS